MFRDLNIDVPEIIGMSVFYYYFIPVHNTRIVPLLISFAGFSGDSGNMEPQYVHF